MEDPHRFATYEEYLDAHIGEEDLLFLEDIELARQLVELGIKGAGDVLSRQEFKDVQMKAERIRTEVRVTKQTMRTSEGKDLSHSPFLSAIARREEFVRMGKLTVPSLLPILHTHSHVSI
jgi:hypothetical protein